MTVYLDTSVAIPLFVDDDHAPRVRAWADKGQAVAISAWTATEFSSALSLQVRMGRLTDGERVAFEQAFDRWARNGPMVEFLPGYFDDARILLRRHSRLRAPDALHLAVARASGLGLATLDAVLRDAALAEGIEVVEL